ncbi:hypothetical protein JCM10212_001115 [Sporobolomyces blumeae]
MVTTTRGGPSSFPLAASPPASSTATRLVVLRDLALSYLPTSPKTALFYAERAYALDSTSEPVAYLYGVVLARLERTHEALHLLRQPVSFSPLHPHEPDLFAPGSHVHTSAGGGGGPVPRGMLNRTSSSSNSGTTTTTTTTTTGARTSRPANECSVRCARLYAQLCQRFGRDKEGRQVLFKVVQPGTLLVPPSSPPSHPDPLDSISPSPGGGTVASVPHPLVLVGGSAGSTTSLDDPASSSLSSPASLAIDLELARLAHRANEPDRAVQSFEKVLSTLPTCWEALETLCQLGHAPSLSDLDSMFPLPKPRPVQPPPHSASTSSTSTLHPGQPSHPSSTHPNGRTHPPPPLGPSQTSTINSLVQPFTFGRTRNGDAHETPLGYPYSTPVEGGPLFEAGLAGARGGFKGKGREVWMVGGGQGPGGLPLRRTGSARYGDVTETSIDEQSFDNSFYPTSAPLFAPSRPPFPAAPPPASSSLFTPPSTTNASIPTATAPGVKRTRAGNVAQSSAGNLNGGGGGGEDSTGQNGGRGKRVVRGVPGGEAKARRGGGGGGGHQATVSAEPPVTRRSSRLSRDANGSSNGTGGGLGLSSIAMTTSRSQSSANGGGGGGSTSSSLLKSANARDKKRSKANSGPSVLSDTTASGSEPRSPPSHCSSPAPSSPGGVNTFAPTSTITTQSITTQSIPTLGQQQQELARQEAEDYAVSLLRGFGKAVVHQAKYENAKVLESVASLPIEQQRSSRGLVLVGRAHFEALNYDKAEKAFAQARSQTPHLVDSMDLYSTTLWHLRSSTTLSLLSQELMLLAPSHPSSWISTGNTFSLNSDHPSALKCFKRAVQLDSACVYAYTLAGHECVMLEEWERAMEFFREAVRRDPTHYNAWFGLGNVYMKTGKHTLADYHFRRALDINPSNATLVCCVGSVLEKSRRYREALETYERACLLAPESALARFRRVRMMVALGKYQLAESDLVQLKSLAPLEPTVHYLLGKLYKSMGPSKRLAMLAAFTTAQDLEPRMASVIREQIERTSQEGMEVDSETGSVA